ncbi:MAG: hypothetical protein ABS35_00150 [Kaistia sp. SCN 65-12]|nr:MAG: hypothetical protein ABS35_00150 [Kaistia sp. SCN 65-12]
MMAGKGRRQLQPLGDIADRCRPRHATQQNPQPGRIAEQAESFRQDRDLVLRQRGMAQERVGRGGTRRPCAFILFLDRCRWLASAHLPELPVQGMKLIGVRDEAQSIWICGHNLAEERGITMRKAVATGA